MTKRVELAKKRLMQLKKNKKPNRYIKARIKEEQAVIDEYELMDVALYGKVVLD